jgi:predicted TPR repeat methyltransferase
MQQGRLSDVFTYYQRALAANPNLFEVHNNLAVSYLALKDNQSALLHFKEALRLQPENKAVQHSMAALSGHQNVQRAPSAYIEQLFDSYADHYDAHLISSLQYALPAQMHELAHAYMIGAGQLRILDLGCGTGLCGLQFKPMAAKLVGVDLSQRMLDEAESKHCYDQLFHEDVMDFLAKPELQFDLIVAADLLVYLGQLDQLFAAVYQALGQGGWFLFNYEGGVAGAFEVQETGRFKHSHAYMLQLIQDHLFKVVGERLVASRTQDGKPIESHVYLIQKS